MSSPDDSNFTQMKLFEKLSIDLNAGMEQLRMEKEKADLLFEEQRKAFEARIDAIEKKVEEQSVAMSMCGSYTLENSNNIEEDIFVKPSFDTESNWSEREFQLAAWYFRKWKYIWN